MAEKKDMKDAIQEVITTMMDRVMNNVLINDPFIPEDHRAKRPIYAALVPDEIFQAAHFERRFVTPFGNVWEKLAVVAANGGMGLGVTGKEIKGKVKAERLRRITEILNRLEHPVNGKRIHPNWNSELAYVLAGDGEDIPVTVVCDVYAENTKTGERFAFELKAPLPNSDQTKVSKEKILKLFAMEPRMVEGAFYALPYNPYGTRREDYSWSFPGRWFDMRNDSVVLIGTDFWEVIGGIGTYQSFITAINEIATEYKERIYREFLGVEPPEGYKQVKL